MVVFLFFFAGCVFVDFRLFVTTGMRRTSNELLHFIATTIIQDFKEIFDHSAPAVRHSVGKLLQEPRSWVFRNPCLTQVATATLPDRVQNRIKVLFKRLVFLADPHYNVEDAMIVTQIILQLQRWIGNKRVVSVCACVGSCVCV